ncbi:hypothetical protein SDC9_197368 [bioreactor metagenome]|uniref:Uncharacterized protein n=1 Tax=bioreactor metagenome TaxID=1076179 RepID=A0A645IFL9_9ZZZZ
MTKVLTSGPYYYVFLDGDSKPHVVDKQKRCNCERENCPAVKAVYEYLKNGGQRAIEARSLPEKCPICGEAIIPDHQLDGAYTKEPGWKCEKGGKHHFYQAKTAQIKANFAKNPWLFKPNPETGYPGILRSELLTAEECAEARRREFMATGYNPAA